MIVCNTGISFQPLPVESYIINRSMERLYCFQGKLVSTQSIPAQIPQLGVLDSPQSRQKITETKGKLRSHQDSANRQKGFGKAGSNQNPLSYLKSQLADLKSQVDKLVVREDTSCQFSRDNMSLYVQGHVIASRGKRQGGRVSGRKDTQGDMQLQNCMLRKQLLMLRTKHQDRKGEFEREILCLNRKLASGHKAFDRQMAEYKAQVQKQINDIRRTLETKNCSNPQRQLLEQNTVLTEKNSELTSVVNNQRRLIEEMNVQILRLMSIGKGVPPRRSIQTLQYSEIKPQSNIFDLTKSKIVQQDSQTNLACSRGCTERRLRDQKEWESAMEQTHQSLRQSKALNRVLQTEIEKQKTVGSERLKQIEQMCEYRDSLCDTDQRSAGPVMGVQLQVPECSEAVKQSIIDGIQSEISTTHPTGEISEQTQVLRVTIQSVRAQNTDLVNLLEAQRLNNRARAVSDMGTQEIQTSWQHSQSEQVHNLHIDLASLQVQLNNAKSLMTAIKLKSMSERKQTEIDFQAVAGNLQSQIRVLKKVNSSLNDKIQALMSQVSKKDEYIRVRISQGVNQTEKLEIQNFFEQYRLEFPIDYLRDEIFRETRMMEELKSAIM